MTVQPARTADDLWRWLLACKDCGQVHEYRREERTRPWASPGDGHPYRMAHDLNAYRLHQLRAKWDASRQDGEPDNDAYLDLADLVHGVYEQAGIECSENDAAVLCVDLAQALLDNGWRR